MPESQNSPTVSDEEPDPEYLRAECLTCGRVETEPAGSQSFKNLDHEFAGHIDDGTACHDYRITEIYEDGSERNVA